MRERCNLDMPAHRFISAGRRFPGDGLETLAVQPLNSSNQLNQTCMVLLQSDCQVGRQANIYIHITHILISYLSVSAAFPIVGLEFISISI
jgi:hypothetical protein